MWFLFTALIAFAQEPTPIDWGALLSASAPGEVLARVDGVPVTVAEWQAAAARRPNDTREAILNDLIDEKLILLAALRGGALSDPKVQKVLVNVQLREAVYGEVRNADFTDDELRAYFAAHTEDFVVPEKRQVQRIFIADAPDAKARIQAAHEALTADPSRFNAVAAEVSEDASRARGGDLGYVSPEGKPGVPDEVITAAWALKVGELSKPFAAGGGWNLITVVNVRARVERTYDQMKGSVLRKVKSERYLSLHTAYTASLEQGAQIERALDRLQLVEIPATTPPQPGSPTDGSEAEADF